MHLEGRVPRSLRTALLSIPLIAILYVFLLRPFLPYSFFSYATRPLWDHSEAPKQLLQHYKLDGLTTEEACRVHGWQAKRSQAPVWDATIFSTELDLLLIRLHELTPVVTRFFIIESNTTFTGLPKPLILQEALQTADFAPFAAQIHYEFFPGRALEKDEHPFAQENRMRAAMTELLASSLSTLPPDTPSPVLLFSDIDEIPSMMTAGLLSLCEFEPPLHLGLTEYMYSFEFKVGGLTPSWRAQAWVWPHKGRGEDEFYRHGKVTERLLVDSGWHCSWCFRTIAEFVTKAKGYSHVDRLGPRPASLLKPSRIQNTICEGSDIFRMLPEAYTWREMAEKWRLLRSKTPVNLPAWLERNPDRFSFLLPGGCVREDGQ